MKAADIHFEIYIRPYSIFITAKPRDLKHMMRIATFENKKGNCIDLYMSRGYLDQPEIARYLERKGDEFITRLHNSLKELGLPKTYKYKEC